MSERPDAWEARANEEDRQAALSRETREPRGTPPASSRRAFLFFLLVAPAGLLAILAIMAALQYKQFQTMVSPAAAVEEFAWTEESRQGLDAILASIRAFSGNDTPKTGSDTLRLSSSDLSLLASASPVLARDRIRFRVTATDSLLVLESSQPVDALTGRAAWIFKRVSPIRNGWLNARVEGLPEWKAGSLALALDRGFLNGAKVPRTALTKRAGMNARDFLDTSATVPYNALLAALDTAYLRAGAVVLVRSK